MAKQSVRSHGFSFIEGVIVLVILGTIAAVAIPRMGHASQNAAETTLAGDMALWRNALYLYQRDHNGSYPKDSATLAAQLTQCTDAAGEISPFKDSRHTFGPYLRDVPALPLGDWEDGAAAGIGSTAVGATPPGGAPTRFAPNRCAWLYDGAGNVYPNTGSLTDFSGRLYNSY